MTLVRLDLHRLMSGASFEFHLLFDARPAPSIEGRQGMSRRSARRNRKALRRTPACAVSGTRRGRGDLVVRGGF